MAEPLSKALYEKVIEVEAPTHPDGKPVDREGLRAIPSSSGEHTWSIYFENMQGGGKYIAGESVPVCENALEAAEYGREKSGSYIKKMIDIGAPIIKVELENYHRLLGNWRLTYETYLERFPDSS